MTPPNTNVPPVSLPILVAFPVAPAWLVVRYLVSTSYKIGSDIFSGGNGHFDCTGGIFQGTIVPKADGTLPDDVTITTTVEYTPESGLPNLTKTDTLKPAVASVVLQLPNRRMANISIVFDFPHGIVDGNYLMIRWAYRVGADTRMQGFLFLEFDALSPGKPRPAKPVVIGFIQDPAPAAPELFHLEIAGLVAVKDLPLFQMDLPLPQSLIFAKIRDDAQGQGIHVELG